MADINAAIARIFIAKPDASIADVRRMLPQLMTMDDKALAQKLEYLRRNKQRIAPARTRAGPQA